jgi:hypothetical protein
MAKVDETNPINKKETKLLQQVCDKFFILCKGSRYNNVTCPE